ncbi:MAG: glucosaminidase domain-containing protein [Puniceicoccales bacterium]|nr:glucosaminidase domain-containing protein [Puniceicoccales bacterium]
MILGAIFVPKIIGLMRQKIVECSQRDTSTNCVPHYLYLLDQPKISEKQIITFFAKNNSALEREYLEKIIKFYHIEAKRESINTVVAIAQMALETGFLRFTGAVKKSQNNFAGIGCIRTNYQGHSFATIEEGIRAHIQHLKAYASPAQLCTSCMDPRRKFIENSQFFGKLRTVYDLSEVWAMDKNYGEKLAQLIQDLLNTAIL